MKKKDTTLWDVENRYHQDKLALRLQLVGEESPAQFRPTFALVQCRKTYFSSLNSVVSGKPVTKH